jgi:cytochrome c2
MGTLILTLLIAISPVFGQDESAVSELFAQRCASCHVLPDPKNLTADMWADKITVMAAMAQIFDEEQKAALLSYLQSNAGSLEEIIAKEREYYESLCSSCHEEAVAPATELMGAALTNFLMDHMIEEADLDIEESDAHEISEFILHTSTKIPE